MPLFYDPTVGVTRTQVKPSPVTYSTGLKEQNKSVQTSDATPTAIWSLTGVLEETTVYVEVMVAAQETSDAERAVYKLGACFYRASGGALLQQGSTVSMMTIESDATYACDFDISSPDLALKVTGAAGDTVNWVATVTYFIVTDS